MPITGFHARTATGADDPAYDVQLQRDWNASHLLTLSAFGSEISGAFGNGGGVSFGLSADGHITAAAPAGAPSPINFSAGTTSSNIGSVVFSDSNGLAFGLNGSTITGSYTQSTHSHSQYSFSNLNGVTFGTAGSTVTASVGTNYAGVGETVGTTAGTDLALTVNTDGVSIGYPKWITTFANDLTSGRAGVGETVGTIAGTDLAMTVNTDGVSIGYPKWITTFVNDLTSGRAGVGETVGTVAGTDVAITMDTNGLSLLYPKYITTARGSTDAIGLNTAQTNVTWTANSSGLSLNAGGYAGTSTTFNGANISGSMTHNTLGLALSLSVAAPGAAAENNAISLLGANVSGNSTATGSTIGWSGVNLTLSGTNNSQVVISAPATSSIVGASGISISTNGSTISVYDGVWASYFDNQPMDHHSGTIDPGGSSIWVGPVMIPMQISASYLRMAKTISHVSTTFGGTSANTTFSASHFVTDAFVLYKQGVGANSLSLQSVTSGSGGWTCQTRIGNGTAGSQYTVTFNVTYPREGTNDSVYTTSYNVSSGTYNVSSQSMSLFTGWRFNDIPFAASISRGNYWIGFGESTTTSNNGPAGLAGGSLGMSWIGVSQTATTVGFPAVATNTSVQFQAGLGFWTTNANVMTKDSMGIASISGMASNIRPFFQLIRRA